MYLLDTNALSATRNPARQPQCVLNCLSQLRISNTYVSVISIYEIRMGIEMQKGKNSPFAEILEKWLQNVVLKKYHDRTLKIDSKVAQQSGMLAAQITKAPADIFIAATALINNLTLVTRNVKDFQHIKGLRLLNPWDK